MSDLATSLPAGWLTEDEAAYLADRASGKTVLEIGAYLGRSTVAMARTAALVVSVDHHAGPPQPQSTFPEYIANVTRYAVSENVIPVVADFGKAIRILKADFELAFVDGDHAGISVLRDGRGAYRLLRIGAAIIFHDYKTHVGVTSGVHELSKHWGVGYELVCETESSAMAVMYKR